MRGRFLCFQLAAIFLPVVLPASDEGCDLKDVPRVVAIGDVHGADAELRAVLRLAGLIDAEDRWSGGKTHLVQTGDTTDRGPDTRQVLERLMRLEGEAVKAGGRVHALLGNHEVMNVVGDLRYVSREEYQTFVSARSRENRDKLLRSRAAAARQAARAANQPFDEASFRRKLEEDVPLGFVERIQAFSDEGRYGRWLRQRPAMVKIGGVVFLHGGLTPEVAALGCVAINATVRREITGDIAKTRQAPLASLAAGESGPLWFRGMAREDETLWQPSLERVLSGMGARTVVIGHTVTADGRITPRFGGRVVMIDVGMNPLYGRHLAALEIAADGSMSALYEGRRDELGSRAARRMPVRPERPRARFQIAIPPAPR